MIHHTHIQLQSLTLRHNLSNIFLEHHKPQSNCLGFGVLSPHDVLNSQHPPTIIVRSAVFSGFPLPLYSELSHCSEISAYLTLKRTN